MSTADPYGAQAHARAMAGTRVADMPVLPPSEGLVWEETLGAGGYTSKKLARGTRLKLEDVEGDACLSLLVFNSEQPTERLNVADTLKVQWNAYLGAGKLILSDMGRVLLSILEDEAQTHDAFCGASSATSNAKKYGEGGNYGPAPSARDRFMIALGKYGMGRKDIHPCLNLFKGTRIAPDGEIRFEGGPFASGRSLTLRAEMDVLVVIANAPHVLDPRPQYHAGMARLTAWSGESARPDDPIRNATPEGQRAFLNVEDYYAR